jgi:hypothetical protein
MDGDRNNPSDWVHRLWTPCLRCGESVAEDWVPCAGANNLGSQISRNIEYTYYNNDYHTARCKTCKQNSALFRHDNGEIIVKIPEGYYNGDTFKYHTYSSDNKTITGSELEKKFSTGSNGTHPVIRRCTLCGKDNATSVPHVWKWADTSDYDANTHKYSIRCQDCCYYLKKDQYANHGTLKVEDHNIVSESPRVFVDISPGENYLTICRVCRRRGKLVFGGSVESYANMEGPGLGLEYLYKEFGITESQLEEWVAGGNYSVTWTVPRR